MNDGRRQDDDVDESDSNSTVSEQEKEDEMTVTTGQGEASTTFCVHVFFLHLSSVQRIPAKRLVENF